MTAVSPRETLDRKIRLLKDDILILGSLVIEATLDAVDALKRRDVAAAQRIYAADQRINAKRFELENSCMVLIATQQPMARDLRILASAFEIANELERMGDYAKGIANICIRMGGQPPIKPLVDLPLMAKLTTDMLHRALGAFIDGDVAIASQIPAEDDQIDALYNQVFRELVVLMIADPSTIDRANFLMWAAHNLERMADRVTNICERAIYVATGQMREFKASDDEQVRKVLFLCTGNSCRSQMAEALVNARLGDTWQAYSAGTRPANYVHPNALRALAEIGIQHQGRSKHVDEIRALGFDLVITVCDSAAEDCPVWLGKGRRVHHSFIDPAAAQGNEAEVMQVFRQVRDEIQAQLPILLKNP